MARDTPRRVARPDRTGPAAALSHRSLRVLLADFRASLAVRCLALLAVYVLALAGVIAGVATLADSVFENAFPSMDTVLEYQGDLAEDRFDALATGRLSSCLIVVFDGDGRRLYASSERAGEKIRASDLAVIGDYEDGSFYEVFEEPGEGGTRYRIMLCSYGGSDGSAKVVESWCELDEDLSIVDGPLFPGRSSLTQREFNLIRGVYNARMDISRLDYETSDGSPRTLVLAAPLVSEASFARVTDLAARVWLLAVPAVLVVSAVAALLLARLVRRAVRPLDRAIDAFRNEGTGRPGAAFVPEGAREAGVPTELVPVYEGFCDLMARLRSSRDDQRRMVASVSHDLKTPLTVIRGYSQAFCEDRVPAGRADAYHRAILGRAVAAAELLDELSDYARMEHPDHAAALVPADARELLTEAVESARPLAEQRGCALEIELGHRPAPILADVRLFRRMVLNLVENAVTHNPAGTLVHVSCAVGCDAGGSRVCRLTVADTGRGIAPEVAGRVFEPFVTEDAARPAGGGTGLGLAIVRRAAELMGGAARVDERPDDPWSTAFMVELPLADAGSPGLAAPASPGLPRASANL